jgi:hypothetical protein
MINVIQNKKLVNINDEIVDIKPLESWNSFEFELDGEVCEVNENDKIEFTIEGNEIKIIGTVLKIKGSKQKTVIEIDCEEDVYTRNICVNVIDEDSLKVIE